MTVTTIPGVGLEVKRTLDNQNKSTGPTAASATPAASTGSGTASLPTDTVSVSVAASQPGDSVATAVLARNVPLSVAEAETATEAENLVAANSTLSDEEMDAIGQNSSPQQQVLAQAKASVAAQTNRLPPSMLQLLIE